MRFITVLCVLLFSFQARVSYGIDTQTNCTTANATCSECYQTLVKNVVHDNDNIFSLLETFFPPNNHPPVFVIVKYYFEDSNTTFTYFWTLKSSFFIVPLEIFQFLSLFFGTPAYHSSSVSLTLPSECKQAKPEYFEMLTYLLKAYAATQSATPRLVDEYTAGRGANAEKIKNVYTVNRISVVIIWYTFLLSLIGNSIIAFVIVQHRDTILNYLGSDEDGLAIKISITIVCTAFFVYVIAVSLAANFYTYKIPSDVAEYYIGALLTLPVFIFTFNTCLPSIVLVIISISVYKRRSNSSRLNSVLESMVSFSVSVVACTFTNHSLYITIAFINDPYHATGVTIYYAMFMFIYLVVLKKVLVLCFKKRKSKCCTILSVASMFVVILGLQILCTFLYIYIPIKDAIDDIPHQLQSLLQLLTTFFVGLITYKFLEQPEKVYRVRMNNT